MICPICPTERESDPAASTQTNIGGQSLVHLPTGTGMVETRKGKQLLNSQPLVFDRVADVTQDMKCLAGGVYGSSTMAATHHLDEKQLSGELQLTSGQRPGGEIAQCSMVGVPAEDSCVNHNHRFMRSPWRAAAVAPRSPACDQTDVLYFLLVLFRAVVFDLSSTLQSIIFDLKLPTHQNLTHTHSYTLQDGLPRDCRGLHGQRPEELDQVREEGGA